MKRTSYIFALIAVVVAWTLWGKTGALQASEPSSNTTTNSTSEKPLRPSGKKPIARLVKNSEPPPEWETAQSKSKIKLNGYERKAVIQDAKGKVLLSSEQLKTSIRSIGISPSGQRAIIQYGEGYFRIYDLEPFREAQKLPRNLDVPRSCGLGKWEWIDDNTLVAISAIYPPESELQGLTAAEKEVDRRVRTLIYTYTLNDGELTEIDPSTVGLPAVFDVVETREGGYLKVVWEGIDLSKAIWIRVQKAEK